jgi:Asp-tRNA(Asn)/Glu-tRNA(Gln) amidotransferase A subunit family amidase
LIGKPLDEQKLLNIAYAAEKKINFKQNLNRWWEK